MRIPVPLLGRILNFPSQEETHMYRILPLFLVAMIGAVPGVAWAQGEPDPVLMVVANQDFYYPDYSLPRQALEAAGLSIAVAAPTTNTAYPHGPNDPTVTPDISLFDVDPAQYSAILFVGGYGASSFQYAFQGTYQNPLYNGDAALRNQVNQLIGDFHDQGKKIGAICYGVTVLAWARIDGVSPLEGHDAVGYFGNSPGFTLEGEYYGVPTAWHVEANGGNFLPTGSVGDPTTSQDDVLVLDDSFVLGESFNCGTYFGEVFAAEIQDWFANLPDPSLPVLMVLANTHFYYREYSETRIGLEAEGREVVVAAGQQAWCSPHANSGQGAESGMVWPDLALADVVADDYAAITFVGGWGSSHYQYEFPGSYNHLYYGDDSHRDLVNQLVNDFVAQDKYVTAICFGVTVLAWARVNGVSVLDGKTVASYPWGSPSCEIDGVSYGGNVVPTSWHMEENGAVQLPAQSIGDPTTAADDVFIDLSNGIRVITAQDYDSALQFGHTLGQELNAE